MDYELEDAIQNTLNIPKDGKQDEKPTTQTLSLIEGWPSVFIVDIHKGPEKSKFICRSYSYVPGFISFSEPLTLNERGNLLPKGPLSFAIPTAGNLFTVVEYTLEDFKKRLKAKEL